ncbi:MAG: hypothetical protein ACLSU0_03370, partial [Oscillospiraceae bacterium]
FPSGSLGRVALCSRGHRSGFDLPSLISHCTNSGYPLFEELQCSSLWRRYLSALVYIIVAIHPAEAQVRTQISAVIYFKGNII